MLRPLELLEIQLETLFDLDARGRIRGVRKSDTLAAPRVYLGRTTEGNLLRLRADIPDALAAELESIAAREPPLARLREAPLARPEQGAALAAALGPYQREYRGPAFQSPPRFARAEPLDWPAGSSTAEFL